MKDEPFISIVIPAYNVEQFIVDAVNSALNQERIQVEVIVVNDGSTDRTLELLESIADSRLRIISQRNKGLSEARNTGVKAAAGKYVGFLDGDDTWFHDKACKQVEVMEQDPSIGITFCHSLYIDSRGSSSGKRLIAGCSAPSTVDLIKRNHIGNGSAAIVRASLLEQVSLFDPRAKALEDYDMWVRLTYVTGCRAVLVPEVLTCYRIHPGSMTEQIEKYFNDGRDTMERLMLSMPHVSRSVWCRAFGEHARITSRRALSSGNKRLATRYMLKALRYCPTLVFRDGRAFANAIFVPLAYLLPGSLFTRLESAVHAYSSRLT